MCLYLGIVKGKQPAEIIIDLPWNSQQYEWDAWLWAWNMLELMLSTFKIEIKMLLLYNVNSLLMHVHSQTVTTKEHVFTKQDLWYSKN